MAKQIYKNENARFSRRYKAVCAEGDLNEGWKATEAEAIQDAIDHQNSHSHSVKIKVEQKQTLFYRVN